VAKGTAAAPDAVSGWQTSNTSLLPSLPLLLLVLMCDNALPALEG
jgi:hypothetical protein